MSKSRPWTKIKIPKSVQRIPAQVALEEKQYLIWLAETAYSGKGNLIELGTLLGASSAALAEGFRRAGRQQKFIAMDYFKWWGDAWRPDGVEDGDDFMPHYQANIREYERFIDARRVDLMEASYDEGPIEILFVDAAKDWDLLNATLRVFGPHLMPGESRVIFQDFRFLAYWILLVIDTNPELWEEIEDIPDDHTVTFRPRSSDTLAWCANARFSDDDFPWEVAAPCFERRIAEASPNSADSFRFAAITKALVEQQFDACLALVAQVDDSQRGRDGIARAAMRGAGLLRKRLIRGSDSYRRLHTIESLTAARDRVQELPEVFHAPLNTAYDAAIMRWQREAREAGEQR